ncbi:hypothetical protein [Priestia filamentosa]|uniref:hypothetical protein n=1 Tax=Priestia filamentosa TaxID=1402861 RepID=UPI0039822F6B
MSNDTLDQIAFSDTDIETIKKQIYKTGFVLENKICKLLEENQWSVINNRYYLDDVENKDREIDIIAYKASPIDDILYYTTFVISCKKSNDKLWAFLTKDVKESDPNTNLYPINNWTNNKVLNFMLETIDIEERILNSCEDNEFLDFVYGMDKQVFAFQQLNKKSFAPQNDKDIYNSITTTIRALEYEKNSLDKRIKSEALYNFNVLSIFDGEMIEVYFDDNEEKITQVDEIKYLNRHIVNKKESFYRVHFMQYKNLESYITKLNDLHTFHVEFYSGLINEYYEKVTDFTYDKGFELFREEFEMEVVWGLHQYLQAYNYNEFLDRVSLRYNKDKEMLYIDISSLNTTFEYEEQAVDVLNADEEAIKFTKRALKEFYKYTGDFKFHTDDLPF